MRLKIRNSKYTNQINKLIAESGYNSHMFDFGNNIGSNPIVRTILIIIVINSIKRNNVGRFLNATKRVIRLN